MKHRIAVLFVLQLAAACAQNPGTLLFPGESDPLLLEWGQTTVEAYLATHQLPASDASVIATYGRQDLRDAVRSFAWGSVQSILADSTRTLSPSEQRVFDRFAASVYSLRALPLEQAVAEKNRFLNNRCTWKPDPDIAKAANYSWDGAFYCPTSVYSFKLFDNPPLNPPKDLFLAWGQKKAWLEPLASRPGGLRSISQISLGGALLLGVGIPAALGLAAAAGYAFTLTVLKVLIFTERISKGVRITGNVSLIWIGVAIGIALMIITIVVVVMLFTENERILAEYPQLDQELTRLRALPTPTRTDLDKMMDDPAQKQLLYTAFLNIFLPAVNTASTAPLPSYRPAQDPVFVLQTPGSSALTTTDSLVFTGWGTEKYTVRMWGGWFLSTIQIPIPGIDTTSIDTRLRFRWNGRRYEAMRMGDTFAVRKHDTSTTDIDCATDAATGLTTAADLSVCKSLETKILPMDLDGQGRKLVQISQQVTFTSLLDQGVALGSPKSIQVTAVGIPAPAIVTTGTLPSGFSFAGGSNGSGTLTWSGSGSPAGSVSIGLLATSGGKSAAATLNVQIADVLRFQTPEKETLTFPVGSKVSVPVTALGSPTPTVTLTGFFPSACGLTASASVNGTVTLSGTVQHPGLNAAGCLFQFSAANGSTGINPGKSLQINVTGPVSQPVLVTTSQTVRVFESTDIRVVTRGASGPVNIRLATDANGNVLAPSWATLYDNYDGTARLVVLPPPLSGPDTVLIPLWYGITGTDGNSATSATDGVLLKIQRTPWWDSTQQFYATEINQTFNTDIRVLYKDGLATADALPPGIGIYPGANGLLLIGNPTRAGDYNVVLSASNGRGTSTFPIRMVVAEKAKIVSPQRVNFYLGKANTFEIQTTGFPLRPLTGAPDGAPAEMSIWPDLTAPSSAIPAGIQFLTSDPASNEPLYGRAILKGTPAAKGSQTVVLRAQTAGLAADEQTLQLVMTDQGDVNGDFQVSCADVQFITSRYGHRKGTSMYDYNADYNQDGVIDVRDTALVSARLPVGTRCQ